MKKWILIALVTLGAYHGWTQRGDHRFEPPPPLVSAPHVAVEQEPFQQALDASALQFRKKDYQFIPLAAFSISAHVISTKEYSFDRVADFAPVDFALGWGRMSDPAVLGRIEVSQSGRWYHWRYSGQPPIPTREIEIYSANMHMIPSSGEIEKKLKSVRAGQIVALKGYLVEVRGKDGWSWKSSLTREDTGPGACETIFVQELDLR